MEQIQMSDGMLAAAGEQARTRQCMLDLYRRLRTDPRFLDDFHNKIFDGLWFRDLEQPGVEWSSPRFYQLMGYPPGKRNQSGHLWERHVDPTDRVKAENQLTELIMSQENSLDLTVRFRRLDGTIIWLNCRAILIRNEEGKAIRALGTHYDVTHFVEHQQALRESQEELVSLHQAAAHDMKQPLATATMLIDSLQHKAAQLDEDGQELLRDVRDSIDTLSALMGGILGADNAADEHYQAVDIEQLVGSVKRDLRAKITRKGAEVRLHNAPQIHGNPVLLRVLFQNLISNAIKYHRDDTPPQVDIYVEDYDTYWEFSITDNGVGIDQRYHQLIFERYARIDKTARREGCGLGLAICRKAVENHHGDIWLHSEPGKGSTFYFRLPKRSA